ncbi:MAG TPA: MFS transporter [Candidatus Dormibacteraeota bacterium]|nr:MFS transporter [Candidatus Dormibacteraeota bacterium]
MKSADSVQAKGAIDASRRWLVLGVLLLSGFLVVLASSVANLALPSIRSSLHAGYGSAEFVIAAYSLAYAVLLITGGRLGDIAGRRNVLVAGLAIFTAGALAGGLAPSIGVLIAMRVVQGAGAALLYPQILSIIQDSFEGDERNRALGLFGVSIGVAFVAGQLLGGALISLNVLGLSWRPAFLLLVLVGVVALAGAVVILPRTRAPGRARLDYAGVLMLTASMVMLVLPLLSGQDAGWPPALVVLLVLSPLAFVILGRTERRVDSGGGSPLINPRSFATRGFPIGCLLGLLFYSSFSGFLIYSSVTLQVGLGFSALAAGLTFLPGGLGFIAGSLVAPRLVPRMGRHVLSVGFLLTAAGWLGALLAVHAAGVHLSGWNLLPGLLVTGVGQGLAMAPLIGTVLSGVSPRDAGSASGVLATSFQLGQAMGVAVVGLIFFVALGDQHSGSSASRYLAAYSDTLPFLAGLATLSMALVWGLPVTGRPNVLLERIPDRLAGLAYSFYFLTGGRGVDRLLNGMIEEEIARRAARVEEAPPNLDEFLVHHFERADEDLAWYRYLAQEALALGSGHVPHEPERQEAIDRQVDEIRLRQRQGLVEPALDPTALRLMAFALSGYPRLLPQVVRMTTGYTVESEEFQRLWDRLLRQLGGRLMPVEQGLPLADEEAGVENRGLDQAASENGRPV